MYLQEGEPIDVGLLLKLQNKVKGLERDKQHLQRHVERMEDDSPRASPTMLSDSAFDALKVCISCQQEFHVVRLYTVALHARIEILKSHIC